MSTYSSCVASTNLYVWGNDLSGTLQGAGGVGGLLSVTQDGETYAPCYDANGNVTEYVNTNGVTVSYRRYDPFGVMTAAGQTSSQNFRHYFSTKCLDVGLYDFGLRPYSPALGRFLSEDPIGEWGGLNLYGFCGNDPINRWDYLGMEQVTIVNDVDITKIVPQLVDSRRDGSRAMYTKYDLKCSCACSCDEKDCPHKSTVFYTRDKKEWHLHCTVTFSEASIVLDRKQIADLNLYKGLNLTLTSAYGHEQRHLVTVPKFVKRKMQDALKTVSDYSFAKKGECDTNLKGRTKKLHNSLNGWVDEGFRHADQYSGFIPEDEAPKNGQGYSPLQDTLQDILDILK